MNKSFKDLSDGTGVAPGIEWLEGGVPKSGRFDDTYFSRSGGLAETRHVFLQGNGLPDRFSGREHFTIGEFGFGTGLNFLTTLDCLHSLVNPPRLTFLSFELYPMTVEQLQKALEPFAVINDHSDELIRNWVPVPGWNEIAVAGNRLCLGIGDARELVKSLIGNAETNTPACNSVPFIGEVDAWYLDGFSPSKNPELWDADLLRCAAELTVPGGTFATYTAAGWVRRNLISAGFEIEKREGFAGKREMVVGRKRPEER